VENTKLKNVPKWIFVIDKINNYLMMDLFGGPKIIKMARVINLHKGLTFFFVLFLMNIYKNFSTVSYIYLALHGSYGFIWVMKHFAFRDKKWELKTTFTGALFIFVFLSTYWVAPYILISGVFKKTPLRVSDQLIALSIIVYVIGIAIMIASDCQKNVILKLKKGLITNGMFRYIRHPNYLGEIMIYSSFAMLVGHWIPWVILFVWWVMVFFVNMMIIEESVSRFPEWEEYKRRTGMLLPLKLFKRKHKV
jgi:protein-S-isoprenylcysteine O-methyltransferase Ste14